MKMRHFFAALAAVFTLGFTVSCDEDNDLKTLDAVQPETPFITLSLSGDPVSTKFTATESWEIMGVRSWDKTNKEYTYTMPDWVTITPTSGGAGETTVTFSAEPSEFGRAAEIAILYGEKTQNDVRFISVQQGKLETQTATCADVIAGADGKTYRVKGKVRSIANTQYGNWFLEDKTGEIYIYGTLDKNGNEKNFTSLGIEVGDEVTVEGPKTTYGTTVELVNVTVIKITKSLLKVMKTTEEPVPAEGGEFSVSCQVKGSKGLFVELTEEQSEWISVKSIQPGTMPNPKDETLTLDIVNVTFNVAANPASSRETTITLSSADNEGNSSQVSATLTQEGSIVDCNIATFLEQPVGVAQFRLSGRIKSIANSTYGNITIEDATGEVYVYGVKLDDGTKEEVLPTLGVKEGDIITIIGSRSEYKGTPQVGGAVYESHAAITKINAADFNALADDANTWYELTGVVTDGTDQAGHKFDLETYGNFDLVDETGDVYVYGLSTGWNGESKQVAKLGLAAGDKITIVAHKASYKDAPQAGNAWFVCKHEEEAPEESL